MLAVNYIAINFRFIWNLVCSIINIIWQQSTVELVKFIVYNEWLSVVTPLKVTPGVTWSYNEIYENI